MGSCSICGKEEDIMLYPPFCEGHKNDYGQSMDLFKRKIGDIDYVFGHDDYVKDIFQVIREPMYSVNQLNDPTGFVVNLYTNLNTGFIASIVYLPNDPENIRRSKLNIKQYLIETVFPVEDVIILSPDKISCKKYESGVIIYEKYNNYTNLNPLEP